ncbi:WD40-repeat-containing domain protein [Lactarius sanguifluus]|nr:WD40-repeat-containing domain protein [Lactarius sanguifluus]
MTGVPDRPSPAPLQQTSVKGQTGRAPDRLVDLMDNAFRLLLHHATTISYDSLLIYDSALFISAMGFHLQMKRNHIYSLSSYSREFQAHSELSSIQEPAFKLCYDITLALAWSPNSQHIALSRLSASETTLEHVLNPHKVSCHCLAFYPDNVRIAYVNRGGRVHVRNTLARTEEFVVRGHDSEGGLVGVNVSPNGKLLVSGSKSGRIQVCDAENGVLIWAVETAATLKFTSVAPNSQLIVSLSYSRNRGIRIWNANDGLPLSILPHDVISVSFSPDCNQLASIDQEGLVRVWEMSQMSTEPIQEWRIGAQPACLVFSPNGRHLTAAKSDVVYILRRDAGDVATLDGHTSRVTSLAFSANGLMLASGSLDGTIRLWDTSSIGSSRVEKDKQEEWNSLRWSPRGRAVMASKYEKRKVWIWNTQDGTSRVLEDRPDGSLVAISDCGRYLGVRSWDPYRMTTRRIASNVAQSNTFSLNVSDRCCYEFFPNSTRFAATFQKKIFTWDASVAHPEVTTSLVGHAKEVDMLCFVPDGSLLLSRAGEEVFAWNVDTLQLVSKTGNVIPRYRTPRIDATKDDWVVMIPPDHGGRRLPERRLFRLPSEYLPHGFWSISESWWSKCILIRCRNGNALIVDFSALTAAVIDFTN